MIDQVDEQLQGWIGNVLGGVDVTLTPPRGDAADTPTVHLYLTQIVPALAKTPDARRAPLQAMLHYLVAVRAAEPLDAHRLLGDLIFAALDNPDFELNFEPLPLEMWLALGAEPQPGFVLKVPLSRDLPQPETALVRKPLVARVTSVTSLQGVVLGGEDQPIYGALVELPGLRQYQRTDSRGRFRFPSVPADPPTKRVRVTAKGLEAEVEIEHAPSAEPVVIRLFEDEG